MHRMLTAPANVIIGGQEQMVAQHHTDSVLWRKAWTGNSNTTLWQVTLAQHSNTSLSHNALTGYSDMIFWQVTPSAKSYPKK